MDWLSSMSASTSALAVLSAMITPAVLISACGTLVLSTSTRLARVIDRVRTLPERIDELDAGRDRIADYESRRAALVGQIDTLARRARLLQFSLTLFYLGVATFVTTSVAIGIVAAGLTGSAWVPVVLALVGALMVLGGSLMLIAESRIALLSTFTEMTVKPGRWRWWPW